MIIFNAKEALHMTLPSSVAGHRVVLAAYSVHGAECIPADEFEQFLQLGFWPALVHTGDHADGDWQTPCRRGVQEAQAPPAGVTVACRLCFPAWVFGMTFRSVTYQVGGSVHDSAIEATNDRDDTYSSKKTVCKDIHRPVSNVLSKHVQTKALTP